MIDNILINIMSFPFMYFAFMESGEPIMKLYDTIILATFITFDSILREIWAHFYQ